MSMTRIMDAAAQSKAVRLSALPTAPQQGRRFVARTLEDWNVSSEVIEVAELITSELVTNAVRHTGRADGLAAPLPTETVTIIRVRVGIVSGSVFVEVWDNSTDAPVLVEDPIDPDAEGGRGLFLVGALAKDWGYWCPRTGGKMVWASIR